MRNHEDRQREQESSGTDRGNGIVQGYWCDPERTQETFVDGRLHTGDLEKVDKDGYLWLMDRKKDMIIRGGENIYSIEVENVLFSFRSRPAKPGRTLGGQSKIRGHRLHWWKRIRCASGRYEKDYPCYKGKVFTRNTLDQLIRNTRLKDYCSK